MPRQSREHQRGFDRAAYNRAAWRQSGDPMSCRICGLLERNRRHDDGSDPVSDDSGMPDERR